jgi:hypothetical protein
MSRAEIPPEARVGRAASRVVVAALRVEEAMRARDPDAIDAALDVLAEAVAALHLAAEEAR